MTWKRYELFSNCGVLAIYIYIYTHVDSTQHAHRWAYNICCYKLNCAVSAEEHIMLWNTMHNEVWKKLIP